MECDYKCHLFCVGDAHTGKTTLTKTYTNGGYLLSEMYASRLNFDFDIKTILVDDKEIRMLLWDTMGQETFCTLSSANKPFYRNKDIILVAYDVNNHESFQHAKDYWYEQIKTWYPSTIVILVGTKADTISKHYSRQVTYEQGLELSSELGIPFFETSSKNFTGLNELFDYCAKVYFVQQPVHQFIQNTTVKHTPTLTSNISSLFKQITNYLTF